MCSNTGLKANQYREQVGRELVGANDYNRRCNDSFYTDYGGYIVLCDDFVLGVTWQGSVNWFEINEE